ncbi:MAG: ribonuclease P protein component [Patescibacteria group bacterium]
MLAAEFRLRKKSEVDQVFRQGKVVAIPAIALRFLPNTFDYSRVAVLVGKKLAKKAVARNRIRRRLREIVRLNFTRIPVGLDLLIIARETKLREIDFTELTAKFLELIAKLNSHQNG